MDRIKRARPSPAMVVALVSLFVALSGVAYAANTVGSADVINDSLLSEDLKNGAAVRSVDVINDSLTGADINESTLGKVPNADKLDGLDSSDFTRNLWAVVGTNPSGTSLVRGHGATVGGKVASTQGQYFVRFNRDITDCGYVASGGDLSDSPAPPVFATVEQRNASSTPNQVLLRVYNGGVPIDLAYGDGIHVAVFC